MDRLQHRIPCGMCPHTTARRFIRALSVTWPCEIGYTKHGVNITTSPCIKSFLLISRALNDSFFVNPAAHLYNSGCLCLYLDCYIPYCFAVLFNTAGGIVLREMHAALWRSLRAVPHGGLHNEAERASSSSTKAWWHDYCRVVACSPCL